MPTAFSFQKEIKDVGVSQDAYIETAKTSFHSVPNFFVEISQEKIKTGSSNTIAGTIFSSGGYAGTGAVTTHEMLTWNPFHIRIPLENTVFGRFDGAVQIREMNKFVKKIKSRDITMQDLTVLCACEWKSNKWILALAGFLGAFAGWLGFILVPIAVWAYSQKKAEEQKEKIWAKCNDAVTLLENNLKTATAELQKRK
jgi:hypothetical protein